MTAPRWFPAAVLVLALLAATVVVGAPAGLGVSLVAAGLYTAAALATPRRDAWSRVWWLIAIALAGVATVRAAGWVVWPALVMSAAVASLAASGGAAWRQVAVGALRAARVRPPAVRPRTRERRARWRPALRGTVIGAALLAVFVPLLASADAAFAHLLARAVPDPGLEHLPLRLAVAAGMAALGAALLRAGQDGPAAPGRTSTRRLARVEWAVPLAALTALFAAFVALQITTLFAGHDHVLRTVGLTYAEYARTGFAQLIAVAALTLAVVAAAARWAARERLMLALLAALCVLTLVILASALIRLGLYVEAFGLTRLRLAAQVHILWLAGLFALILVLGHTRHLPRAAVALSAATVLGFALADPDRRIAEHNVDRYERTGRIDERYLSVLGADAAPALARLPAPVREPAAAGLRRALADPDGLAGLNLARARARTALR